MTRTCTRCKVAKDTDSFCRNKRAKDGLNTWCRSCCAEAEKQRNPAVRRAYFKKWYDKSGEHRARKSDYGHRARVKMVYGITASTYDAMLVEQGGRCAICRREETKVVPRSVRGVGTVHRLSVDHDHRTGDVRGLLCQACNRAIGLLHDDPDIILAAARYVAKHQRARIALAS